eukprot:scaffold5708_cov107-Isochrysis_galbana.AAC.4
MSHGDRHDCHTQPYGGGPVRARRSKAGDARPHTPRQHVAGLLAACPPNHSNFTAQNPPCSLCVQAYMPYHFAHRMIG